MKKLILCLVFIFTTGTNFLSAESTEINVVIDSEIIKISEDDFGCASDCVQWAKGLVFELADNNNDDPNDYQFYMDIYMRYYTGCLRGCE